MRTTIDIPDELMKTAMDYFGSKSKREAVVQALTMVQRKKSADALLKLAGKVPINLNLDELRKRPGSKRDPWRRSP